MNATERFMVFTCSRYSFGVTSFFPPFSHFVSRVFMTPPDGGGRGLNPCILKDTFIVAHMFFAVNTVFPPNIGVVFCGYMCNIAGNGRFPKRYRQGNAN
jgi:hypothetical protein